MGRPIGDGTGTGFEAKVDKNHRLHAMSLIEEPLENLGHQGRAFWVTTDFINITTTASYSGVLYLKNTNTDKRIHLSILRNASTVNALWRMLKNPTTGTLITGGTAVIPENAYFTSTSSANAVAIKGANALTLTDGSLILQAPTAAYIPFISDVKGGIILGPGNSVALEVKPTATADIGVGWAFWEEEIEE